MMPVVMLGSDYRYSLSAYRRGPSSLGAAFDVSNPDTWGSAPSNFDWSTIPASGTSHTDSPEFWTGLTQAIGAGLTGVSNFINSIRGKTSSSQDSKRLDAILDAIASGKLTGSDTAKKAASFETYLPWIIGGGAVLIALMFMVGTRRR
jgi:hypothetical protein